MSSKAGQSFRMSDGDWICEDESCQNINFARRMNCNLCGKDKPVDSRLKDKDPDKKRKLGHEIGKVAADKSKGLFSADDWQCGRCGNVNWARRSTCNMCSAPKFGENEERTGLGGGYNEREQVEYVRREEESEDEYDDFGRKKKKKQRLSRDEDEDEDEEDEPIKSTSRIHKDEDTKDSSKSNNNEDEEDEEEDDDEDGDVSKYKLDSDEEEEEDDDDGDLSKYDLTECLEDKK